MTAKGVNGAHVNGAHAGDRPKKYRRPELYTNREIALVDFSRRVFEEAQNPRHPLLERVKFLAFVGSQLDEFLMVRVAGLYDQIEAQVTEAGPDGIPPRQLLEQVNQRVKALLNETRRYFEHESLPQLTLTGIEILPYARLTEVAARDCGGLFQEQHPAGADTAWRGSQPSLSAYLKSQLESCRHAA